MRRRVPKKRRVGQEGQVLPFVLLIAFLAVSFLIVMVNLGVMVERRVQLQGAADASAYAGTQWTARGMNLVSQNNVLMTSTFVGMTFIEAYKVTVGLVSVYGAILFASNCPANVALCAQLLDESTEVAEMLASKGKLNDAISELNDGLTALQQISREHAAGISALAVYDAQVFGELNGADYSLLSSNSLNLTPYTSANLLLPLEPSDHLTLCDPAVYGSLGGYDSLFDWHFLNNTLDESDLGDSLEAIEARIEEKGDNPKGPISTLLLWAPHLYTFMERTPEASMGGLLFGAGVLLEWPNACDGEATDNGPLLLSDRADAGQYVTSTGLEAAQTTALFGPLRFQSTTAEAMGMWAFTTSQLYNPFSLPTGDGSLRGDTFTPQWRPQLRPMDSDTWLFLAHSADILEGI